MKAALGLLASTVALFFFLFCFYLCSLSLLQLFSIRCVFFISPPFFAS